MSQHDLEYYWKQVIEKEEGEAKQIVPEGVVTAPWVRLKCQYGCSGYHKCYCCPPDTPTPAETRAILDCYHRAILFHFSLKKADGQQRKKVLNGLCALLVELEGKMFKDGFYKAFALLAGPCMICEECGKLTGDPCNFRNRARPSMEACGIDVYQTARNHGFPIDTMRDKMETQNAYFLLLVD